MTQVATVALALLCLAFVVAIVLGVYSFRRTMEDADAEFEGEWKLGDFNPNARSSPAADGAFDHGNEP